MEIVHYFDKNNKEDLIYIFIDEQLFMTMLPDQFANINPNHLLVYEAIHYNIFSK